MTKINPLLSVIIPALNAAERLHEALASLDEQTVDVEAVLIDGGSRDATVAIASAHRSLRVISAPGSSIYEAINRGIEETSAPAIVLLMTDDSLLPGAVASWCDALAEASATDIARGWPTFVEKDDNGVVVPLIRANNSAAGPLTLDVLLRGGCAINTMCIRRRVFDRIGLFDTRYRLAADRDWMLRALIAGVSVVEVDRIVYRYLSHPGSATIDRSRRNYELIRREHLDIATRYLSQVHVAEPALRRAVHRWHAVEAGILASHQARGLELRELASTVANATRANPIWPLTLTGECLRWLSRWISFDSAASRTKHTVHPTT